MSDSSQTIVDIDVAAQTAEQLCETVLAWLISEGIVERDTSDSVLGGVGHRPGVNYRAATVSDADLYGLQTNGVEAVVGRRVFDAGQNGIQLHCNACRHEFEPDSAWIHAVGAWAEGDDQACYACPECGERKPVPEWRGPRQWGCGNLAFRFWNWPPLSEHFIQSLSERLGHRTVLVRSHV